MRVHFLGNHIIFLCQPLFLAGQLLTRRLLGKGLGNRIHILSHTQLGQTLRRCALDGLHILGRHGLLILLHQFVQLTAGKALARIQLLLHLLRISIARINLQCFSHQRPGIAAVDLLCLVIASRCLYAHLNAGTDAAGDRTAQHIKRQVISHAFPCLFLGLILTKAITHVLLHQDVEITLIPHHQLIGEVVEQRGNTFLRCLNASLQQNITEETAQFIHAFKRKQLFHAESLACSLCKAAQDTEGNCLLIGCTPVFSVIHAAGRCRAEEYQGSTNAALGVSGDHTLGNTGGQLVSIAPALATNDLEIIIQRPVFFIQRRRDCAGDRLGYLSRHRCGRR